MTLRLFLFITSILVTIAEFDTFPYGLRWLPFVILTIYEVFVTLLFSNAVLYLVWLPLLPTMSNLLIKISYGSLCRTFHRTGSDVVKGCVSLVSPGLELEVELPPLGNRPLKNTLASLPRHWLPVVLPRVLLRED